MTPGFASRWRLLAVAAGAAVAAVFVVHPAPWGFLLRTFTLDPATGWYRLLIWSYAVESVIAHPWVGIGLVAEWARPAYMGSSVDAHWLRTAMVWGIPASALFAATMASAGTCRAGRPRPLGDGLHDTAWAARILGIVIFGYAWAGFTVHFWGANALFIALACGLRVNLCQPAPAPPARAAAPREAGEAYR